MSTWWTGKGYGLSTVADITGRPLLTYQGVNDKKPILLADRVAQTFDFTIKQQLTAGEMRNDRMDSAVASATKKLLGGGTNDELDHKISLELGGSNTPANLFVQPGITSGASAASDTIENNLALDVCAGKISLLDAWRTLEDQKNFLLVEDMTTNNKIDATALMLQLAGNLKDYITGKKKAVINGTATDLKTAMQKLLTDLTKDPTNQVILTNIIQTQVQIATTTQGLSTADAAQQTKMTIAAYAQSKGIDPREIVAATNLNVQKIIDNSKRNPSVFGISTVAIATIMSAAAGVLSTVGIVAFLVAIIGICFVGPEAIAGVLTGGLFESIGGLIGLSPVVGISFATVAVTEGTAAMMFLVGQGIKSIYDSGYLLPTQNIDAIKNALAIQKGLSGFLPSTVTSPGTTGTTTTTTSTGTATKTATTKVFTGIVSQGVVTPGLTFEARPNNMISTVDDLKHAATNNLAPFLQALPGKVIYEIKIVSSVTTKDGFVQRGTTQKIQTGTTKTGVPTYKTITNKFATLILYIMTDKGNKTKISTIVLGPVDSAKLQVAQSDLTAIQTDLPALVTTTNIADITSIVSTQPITIQTPVATTPVQTTPSAPVQTTPSAPVQTTPSAPIQTATTTVVSAPATVTVVSKPVVATVKPGANATTLYDWYQAQGQTLPSISARATIYQSLGLGQASYYTGTAEQNTTLLNKLKSQ